MRAFWISSIFIFLLLAAPCHAQVLNSEQILSFDSKIEVHKDSSLSVIETIKVAAAGDQIKHGIYRDFPTDYRDFQGIHYRVGFRLLSVNRGGQPEPYHTEDQSNGIRIYVGDKNTFLPAGIYTYTLTYQTTRQLGFFEDHDELYWNVTGHGWIFSIQKASAEVILPDGAKVLLAEAFTGYQGSMDKDFILETDARGVRYQTKRSLQPKQGLTIVVSWPKGFIQETTAHDKLAYFFQDNRGICAALIGLFLILFYYIVVWSLVGRDPRQGPIVPSFHPPSSLTPADIRYIIRMGFDHKAFAATVVNMAVKGFLKIETKDGEYILRRTGAGQDVLSDEELQVISKLIPGEKIVLKNTHYSQINGAVKSLEKILKTKFYKTLFFTNNSFVSIGGLISAAAILLTGFIEAGSGSKIVVILFMSVWLAVWTAGVFTLVSVAAMMWKTTLRGGGVFAGARALSATLFALPFVIGEIIGLGMLWAATSFFFIVFIILVGFLNYLFIYLLKSPTVAGRRTMDQIEGFKMYLTATEQDRLQMPMAGDKTPELFERYLPYAIALDVERAWSDQFTEQFKVMEQSGQTYTPAWYSGYSGPSFSNGNFAENLGSGFANVISSSSTAPGSSSGGGGYSGGGGSSGGGGGGGGGGGW